mgnify:CR=1 FL=1|jgi:hypothetical protein
MEPRFHEVLYRLAHTDADSVTGSLKEGAETSRAAECTWYASSDG